MADYSSLIPEGAVSPKELAQLWNCTVFQVYGWINYGIKRGDKKVFLEACRLGGSWVIDPVIAEKFISEMNPGRHQPKPKKNKIIEQEAVTRASSWLAR